MSKKRSKPRGNEHDQRHREKPWAQLLEVFGAGHLHFRTHYYLDVVERRVISLPKESVTAEHEYLRARLESAPHTLVRIPCYSSADKAKDWADFLLAFPDAAYRKKLDVARHEFNGGPRDLSNRLVEDYPHEEARWTDFRDKRMQSRLESWLQSVGLRL